MRYFEILSETDKTNDWTTDAYHGTTADFDEFKNKRFAQLGYHFGSTPDQANSRIKGKRTGAQVMPVKLKLKNPLYVHDMEDWSPSSVIWGLRYSYDKKQEKIPAPLNALLQKLSKDFHEMDFNGRAAAISEIGEIWHKNNYPHRNETPKLSKLRDKIFAKHARQNEDAQSKMLIDGLKSLGYDGIVYDNRYEGEGVSCLVFDSNQVRSRFAKFDPSKADSGIITDSIIFEKVETRDLREQAFAAIFSALRAEPDKRLEEIANSLSIIANRYNSQWKSGIKNARGYELEKMHLMFEVTFSPKHGGSFSHSKIDYDGNEMRVARIIFNIVPYDELFEDKVPQKFAIDFSNSITDAFVHEMIHYTQSVKIKTSDSARISRIEDVQSVGTHKDEKMTDEKRKRYYNSINEIDAYAANAASELAVRIGVDAARAKMKNFSELAQYSPIIARYIKYAKDRPKAWKRFMSQVAFQLDQV